MAGRAQAAIFALRARCLSAYAMAASRTQAPSAWAVRRCLRYAFLGRVAPGQLQHQVVTLPLMEALFPAYTHHGAGIRTVGAPAQRDLIHDRGAVDQPADRADIRPGRSRVVENTGI